MNSSVRHPGFLSACRIRRPLTVPLAAILILFQTLHGSLLQAQHIANLDFSLSEIGAPTNPPETTVTTGGPDTPIVVNHADTTDRSFVSEERRQEVMANAAMRQYHFEAAGGDAASFVAKNPTRRLGVRHAASGLSVTPLPAPRSTFDPPAPAPEWSVTFQTSVMTLDALSIPCHQTGTSPSISGNQSSLDLAPGINEWFINRGTGIKHGYTIQQPVDADPHMLTLRIDVTTGLVPGFDAANQQVDFRDQHERTVLSYQNLVVFDHLGRELPSSMKLDGSSIVLSAEVADAVFPVTVDPDVVGTQQGGGRMAGDAATGDGYGTSSAGHGNVMAVGAPDKGNGVVYLQERNAGGTDNWGETEILSVPASESPGTDDGFGTSVAVGEDASSGNPIVAVGAPRHGGCGAVFIFMYVLGVWTFLQKLAPTSLTLGALFGTSLALFGRNLAVGAIKQGGPGAVFTFALVAGLYVLSQTITRSGAVAGDNFGFAVALFGTFLVIGAPGESQGGFARAGAAYLYTAAALGALFYYSTRFFSFHPNTDDEMGRSVAVTRDRLAIAVPGSDGWPGSGFTDSGHVYVWSLASAVPTALATIFGVTSLAFFGYALALNFFGDLAIGSPGALTNGVTAGGAIFMLIFNAITLTYATGGGIGPGGEQILYSNIIAKIIPSGFIDAGMFFGASIVLLGTFLFGMAPRYNSSMGAFFLFVLAATALTFASWQLLFFTQQMIDTLPSTGFFGDYDGDGIPNFVEFAMALLPTVFDSGNINGSLRNGGGRYSLVFPVSLVALNVLFLLQYTINLTNWYGIGSGPLAATLESRVRKPGITANQMAVTLDLNSASGVTPGTLLRYTATQP